MLPFVIDGRIRILILMPEGNGRHIIPIFDSKPRLGDRLIPNRRPGRRTRIDRTLVPNGIRRDTVRMAPCSKRRRAACIRHTLISERRIVILPRRAPITDSRSADTGRSRKRAKCQRRHIICLAVVAESSCMIAFCRTLITDSRSGNTRCRTHRAQCRRRSILRISTATDSRRFISLRLRLAADGNAFLTRSSRRRAHDHRAIPGRLGIRTNGD